ncbi:MAG: HIT domain-containing protein [Patescibacteria group bacterium]|nr:HIT domain-containing protein [Patescibacteria group bacterium]
MTNCIFCKIIKGEIPSYKIYEDENYLAFLDIFPKTEGHCLVIPKKHVEWVWEVKPLGEYFEVVGKIARHLQQKSGEEVVRSLVYGVEVPHAHVHLLPGKTDNLKGEKLSGKELEKIQKKFRDN